MGEILAPSQRLPAGRQGQGRQIKRPGKSVNFSYTYLLPIFMNSTPSLCREEVSSQKYNIVDMPSGADSVSVLKELGYTKDDIVSALKRINDYEAVQRNNEVELYSESLVYILRQYW